MFSKKEKWYINLYLFCVIIICIMILFFYYMGFVWRYYYIYTDFNGEQNRAGFCYTSNEKHYCKTVKNTFEVLWYEQRREKR